MFFLWQRRTQKALSTFLCAKIKLFINPFSRRTSWVVTSHAKRNEEVVQSRSGRHPFDGANQHHVKGGTAGPPFLPGPVQPFTREKGSVTPWLYRAYLKRGVIRHRQGEPAAVFGLWDPLHSPSTDVSSNKLDEWGRASQSWLVQLAAFLDVPGGTLLHT